MQIIARKHDGQIAKIFHGVRKLFEDDETVAFYYRKNTRVDEVKKGSYWLAHYSAYVVLPKQEWYNFMLVEKDDGLEYYCNLASPPIVEDDAVSYIDYDIDVVRSPDGTVAVHDLDEFAERIDLYDYPPDLVTQLRATQNFLDTALHERRGYF